MVKLLVLFTHLLGTCLALGMIALTDARLVAKVLGFQVVIPPPSRFETRAIAVALLVQIASGAVLVGMGLAADPAYLQNPKLQAKLLLVALLCANAFVLHYLVFPSLERSTPVARWSARQRNAVSVSVGLSNSMWLYCAFLGIARPWNHVVPIGEVLLIGAGVWCGLATGVRCVLSLAARNQPEGAPDWLDVVKATLSGLSGPHELGGYAPKLGAEPAPLVAMAAAPRSSAEVTALRLPNGPRRIGAVRSKRGSTRLSA